MAGNVYTWSTTAASNDSADSDINWLEGQLPGTVNNSARGMMAASAGFLKDNNATLSTAGAANAYTVTSNIAIAALATGLRLRLKASFSNTGAATLTLTPAGGAAFAAKAIRKVVSGGADAALASGDIQNNQILELNYDAAANSAAGAWILLNPATDLSAYAPIASPTFTGTVTIPTATITGNATVAGTLGVTGATTLSAAATIGGTLTVTNQNSARVYNSANLAIPDITATILTFDSEEHDDNTLHSVALNTSRLTAQVAGTYVITGHVQWALDSFGHRVSILKNGLTYLARASLNYVLGSEDARVRYMGITTIAKLAATDYVQIEVYHNSGKQVNVEAAAGWSPYFSMTRVCG